MRLSIRVRNDHPCLAVRFGVDPARLLVALGAVFSREALALGLHSGVHTHLGVRRELGAIDANVDDLDTVVDEIGAARA